MQFTATVEQGENGWLVGQVNELPAAISQGKTIEELKANLIDAIRLIFIDEHLDCVVNFL